MRVFLWIAFIAVILFIAPITNRITDLAGSENTIVKVEFAGKADGAKIIQTWSSIKYTGGTLLDQAGLNTRWDFVFILIYVLLIITESNSFMAIEPSYPLNELLRMNIFLAVIAGLLDVLENFFILHNISTFHEPAAYLSSETISYIKFVLAAWCVVIWLIAIVHQIYLHFKQADDLPLHIAYLNAVIYPKEETLKLSAVEKFDIIAYLQDNTNSIEFRVKNAILFTYGDKEPDPSEIANDRTMSDLGFQDFDIERLTKRFHIVIEAEKSGAPELNAAMIGGLANVQACIDQVTTSLK